MPYVSITGLRLKGRRHWIQFWWHAIRSMRQAQKAHGNLQAQGRIIKGVHHTLSVWTDAEAMRAYVACGAHLKAMKIFKTIATGKTIGFNSDTIPKWSEVHNLWLTKAHDV